MSGTVSPRMPTCPETGYRKLAFALLFLIGAFSVLPPRFANAEPLAGKATETAIFRYRTGDASPDVLNALRTAVLTGQDAATKNRALFFLGRFYQREFELRRDIKSLKLACQSYQTYTEKAKNRAADELIADARFYKALCQLESAAYAGNDNRANALKSLAGILERQDKEIYIDRIVWSEDASGGVNMSYPSGVIRDAMVGSIRKHMQIKSNRLFLSQVALDLKQWCTSYRPTYQKR